jgi:DNA-binding transcriptional regulator YdaS (Cro superfamily)
MAGMTLSDYLKRTNTSMTAFAASIGVSLSSVHGWTTGRRNPEIRSLLAMERVTGGAVRTADFQPQPLAAPPRPATPEPKRQKAANDTAKLPKRSRAKPVTPPAKPKRTPRAESPTPTVEKAA